jgi:hypothetical protein
LITVPDHIMQAPVDQLSRPQYGAVKERICPP